MNFIMVCTYNVSAQAIVLMTLVDPRTGIVCLYSFFSEKTVGIKAPHTRFIVYDNILLKRLRPQLPSLRGCPLYYRDNNTNIQQWFTARKSLLYYYCYLLYVQYAWR